MPDSGIYQLSPAPSPLLLCLRALRCLPRVPSKPVFYCLSFSMTTVSGHMCSVRQSFWILASQRILTFSLSLSLARYFGTIVPNVAGRTSLHTFIIIIYYYYYYKHCIQLLVYGICSNVKPWFHVKIKLF